ncbi:hypothetical protein PR048_002125 [Dryococelus australis]|uniref:Uncharacterized protein n=1 Tax=Dryococelus australis TaxID=614101 RepID=A0ABQ9IJ94_9NEOP|nr:hypothetical protein PR048_002125 [Dryococelus australis]
MMDHGLRRVCGSLVWGVWRKVYCVEEGVRSCGGLGVAGMKMRGKREIPEKTRRPAPSSGTIPTCENQGVVRRGIEPSSPQPFGLSGPLFWGTTPAKQQCCDEDTVSLLASHQGEPGSILGRATPASGNRDGRCRWSAGFLGNPPFPPSFHSGAFPYSLQSPTSALKTSLLRASQISSLTHSLDETSDPARLRPGTIEFFLPTAARRAVCSSCTAFSLAILLPRHRPILRLLPLPCLGQRLRARGSNMAVAPPCCRVRHLVGQDAISAILCVCHQGVLVSAHRHLWFLRRPPRVLVCPTSCLQHSSFVHRLTGSTCASAAAMGAGSNRWTWWSSTQRLRPLGYRGMHPIWLNRSEFLSNSYHSRRPYWQPVPKSAFAQSGWQFAGFANATRGA